MAGCSGGAVASCALTLVLLSLAPVSDSPWYRHGPIPAFPRPASNSAPALYFIVMAMISSAIGGYLAGRLRNRWIGVQSSEVHFRDTAHGFLAWALASVFGAILLASPAASLLGGAASARCRLPTPHRLPVR